MIKLILLVALTVTTARAQVVTSHLVMPAYGGVLGSRWRDSPGANLLMCWRLPARMGITNATKFAAVVAVASGLSSSHCGFALYPDNDGANYYAHITDDCKADKVVTASGLTPFSIAQGEILRLCVCSDITTGFGAYLAVWDIAPVAGDKNALLNSLASTHAKVALLGCIMGNPPVTTGGLVGAAQTVLAPVFLVEN